MKRTIRLAAALATCVALAGCSAGRAATEASAPLPLSPADALQASLPAMAAVTYDVAISGGGETETGSVDPMNKAAQVVLVSPLGGGQNMRMSNLDFGGKIYLKIDVGTANHAMHVNPKAWMLINSEKLHDDVALPLDARDSVDPLDLDGLLQAVTSVARTDSTHYTGVMDLTKAGGTLGPDSDALAKAGSKASSVPFTATLDARGRLLHLTIDAAKVNKDLSLNIVITNYGTGTKVEAPATSKVITTPSSIYSMLNG